MALDPRISLAATAPQVPSFDLVGTLAQAEQIRAMRQQEQMRQVQLSELLRQRQNDLALQELNRDIYARRGIGLAPGTSPSVAPSMASAVPPALPGTSYVQSPAQASYMDQNMSPGNLAPPGATAYQRAPDAMQAPQALPLPATAPRTMATAQGVATAMPGTPQPPGVIDPVQYAAVGGEQGLKMAETMQRIQGNQAVMQENQMDRQIKAMQYLSRALAIPNDEATYQEMRADITEKEPRMGKVLPEHYDAQAIADIQKRLQAGMARGQQRQYSKEITWGKRGTQDVALQASSAGGLDEAAVPEGVRVLPPTTLANQGTVLQPIQRFGGEPAGTALPINVAEKKQQEVSSEAEAKYEAEFAARKLKARETIDRIGEKHALALEKVTKAMDYIKNATYPDTTAGKLGMIARAFNLPSAMGVASMIKGIQSQLGLDELVNLKTMSGAGLGNVSNEERQALGAAVSNINPDEQTAGQLWESLHAVTMALGKTRERLDREYQKEFVEQQGRPPGPGRATGARQPQRPPTLEEIEAEIARRQRGLNATP